jgi:hypothetical protein
MAEEFGWLHDDQTRHLIKEVSDYAGLGSEIEGAVLSERMRDGAVMVTIMIAKKVLDTAPKKA